MTTSPYAVILRQLRDAKNYSQSTVAEKLQISRTSYIALEQGSRELSLREAVALTTLYGIGLDDLLAQRVPNEQKYIEMIQAVLRCAATDKQVIKKTKLSKLLYIIDFSWFYLTKSSMSGVAYRHVEFGPTPDVFFRLLDELESAGTIIVTQVIRDDYHMYELAESRAGAKNTLGLLSKKELAHISAVWTAWKSATTAEILKFTIEQSPYRATNTGELIPYDLILTEAPHEVM